VQDLQIAAHNTRYRRTVYRLPDGSLQVAARPADVQEHFGVGLKQFVLYQVHQTHVSQARLLEQLREYGIDISAGQVNEMLLQGHDAFHAEKDALLPTAREVSGVLHTDDTSARHCGQNAVCTHIGNELFASFHTTDSKLYRSAELTRRCSAKWTRYLERRRLLRLLLFIPSSDFNPDDQPVRVDWAMRTACGFRRIGSDSVVARCV
jgi:hypothetical protein